MIKRNPERPKINSQNIDSERRWLSDDEVKKLPEAWKNLALSGEKDLENAYLQGADLQGMNLKGVNLSHANLASTQLQRADLQGANLFNANLHFANLQNTNLQYANLQYAKLLLAVLKGANLLGSDLTGVKFLTEGQRMSTIQIVQSEFSEIPEDFRSYEPVNRLLKAQSLRK